MRDFKVKGRIKKQGLDAGWPRLLILKSAGSSHRQFRAPNRNDDRRTWTWTWIVHFTCAAAPLATLTPVQCSGSIMSLPVIVLRSWVLNISSTVSSWSGCSQSHYSPPRLALKHTPAWFDHCCTQKANTCSSLISVYLYLFGAYLCG